MGRGSVTVQIQCINKGPQQRIQFQAKTAYGSISNRYQNKNIRSTGFVSFMYTPPNSSAKKGKADRITVTAKKPSTGETFSQDVSILLVM